LGVRGRNFRTPESVLSGDTLEAARPLQIVATRRAGTRVNESQTTQRTTGNGILLASLILAEVHDRRWRWLALGTGAALLARELLALGSRNGDHPVEQGLEEMTPRLAIGGPSFEEPWRGRRHEALAVPRTIPQEHHDWDDLEPSGD
jgi:hypothetical protein